MKLVSIITVNFNQPLLTEQLLQSIIATNSYNNIEIIVVDNGSSINPLHVWVTAYPEIIFLRSEKNLGFAGGNNLAIQKASGEYLFLVNNDTEFTHGLIKSLVDLFESNKIIGVISPKIKFWENKNILQYAGFTAMNFVTARNSCIGYNELDNGQYDKITGETAYAHGAAMMVKREVLIKAGLMAENFFLYYEELDWMERIKKSGYKIWVCMDALIYHKESMSVGKKSILKEYYMNRNRILFIRKNGTCIQIIIFYCYFILVVTPRNILQYLKNKNYSFIKALLKAIWWNFTNKTNSLK